MLLVLRCERLYHSFSGGTGFRCEDGPCVRRCRKKWVGGALDGGGFFIVTSCRCRFRVWLFEVWKGDDTNSQHIVRGDGHPIASWYNIEPILIWFNLGLYWVRSQKTCGSFLILRQIWQKPRGLTNCYIYCTDTRLQSFKLTKIDHCGLSRNSVWE